MLLSNASINFHNISLNQDREGITEKWRVDALPFLTHPATPLLNLSTVCANELPLFTCGKMQPSLSLFTSKYRPSDLPPTWLIPPYLPRTALAWNHFLQSGVYGLDHMKPPHSLFTYKTSRTKLPPSHMTNPPVTYQGLD